MIRLNAIKRLLGYVLALLLLSAASYAYEHEVYTGDRPGGYTTLDPTLSRHYLVALNDLLAQGKITFTQYNQAITQASHGVRPSVLVNPADVRVEPHPHPIPSPIPTPAPSPSTQSCDGIHNCGPCFYTPGAGWHLVGACIPGDPSEIAGCDYSACGVVPDGAACGAIQPGASGYNFPCQSGSICVPPSPIGNFAGVCHHATSSTPGATTARCNGGSGCHADQWCSPNPNASASTGDTGVCCASDPHMTFMPDAGPHGACILDSQLERSNGTHCEFNSQCHSGFCGAGVCKEAGGRSPTLDLTKQRQTMDAWLEFVRVNYGTGPSSRGAGFVAGGQRYRNNLQPVVDAFNSAQGTQATVVGDDKIDFHDGFGPIDVITSAGDWWFGGEAGSR
jgi:hypothetical protein